MASFVIGMASKKFEPNKKWRISHKKIRFSLYRQNIDEFIKLRFLIYNDKSVVKMSDLLNNNIYYFLNQSHDLKGSTFILDYI